MLYLQTRTGKKTKIRSGDEIIWGNDGTVQFSRKGFLLFFFIRADSKTAALRIDQKLYRGTRGKLANFEASELLACACGFQLAAVGKSCAGDRSVYRFI